MVIGVGGSVYQVVAKMFYVVQIHDYPCCMESAIVLLKYLRLSEILCIHGIPVAVIAAVTVRLCRWNTPIYRSWAGVVMSDLPLLERYIELIAGQFDLISGKGVRLCSGER